MMTPERWSQIKDIFTAVMDRSAEERQSALVEACQGDTELQAELRQLLAQHDEMGKFLDGDTPPSATSILNPGYLLAKRYEIVALLGSGGMGEVYEAQDQELGGRIRCTRIGTLPLGRQYTTASQRHHRGLFNAVPGAVAS